ETITKYIIYVVNLLNQSTEVDTFSCATLHLPLHRALTYLLIALSRKNGFYWEPRKLGDILVNIVFAGDFGAFKAFVTRIAFDLLKTIGFIRAIQMNQMSELNSILNSYPSQYFSQKCKL